MNIQNPENLSASTRRERELEKLTNLTREELVEMNKLKILNAQYTEAINTQAILKQQIDSLSKQRNEKNKTLLKIENEASQAKNNIKQLENYINMSKQQYKMFNENLSRQNLETKKLQQELYMYQKKAEPLSLPRLTEQEYFILKNDIQTLQNNLSRLEIIVKKLNAIRQQLEKQVS